MSRCPTTTRATAKTTTTTERHVPMNRSAPRTKVLTKQAITHVATQVQRYFAGRNGTGVNMIALNAVLRPVSTLLIISMVGLSLQPLVVVAQTKDSGTLPPQIAQWLPKTQAAQAAVGARRVQSPSDAAPAPLGLIAIEEALKRAVPERFATAPQLKSAATDQALTLIQTARTVLAQQDNVAAEARQAREQFAVDRELLQQDGLNGNTIRVDPMMLQRHTDTVAAFEARASEFAALMQGLKRSTSPDATQDQPADGSGTTKAALQALAAFIKKYPNQRAHQATDPNNLPFKLAKAEVRAPIEDAQALAGYLAQAERAKNIAKSVSGSPASTYPILPDSARRIERAPSSIPTTAQIERLEQPSRTKASTTQAASAADIAPPAAADLAETEDIQLTPAIRAKAAALNYNPVEIYNWVRNTIEFLPTYGSIQGADMTLLTGKGNAFDTASLTIALLRASGIYAKYVYGTVEIPADQVQNWVGNVKTPEAAQSLMSQGGIPNVALISGGKIAAFRLEHVWVEAYVSYYPSRGANHRGDPANAPTSPKGTPGDTWAPMDTSFKRHQAARGVDVLGGLTINRQAVRDQLFTTATINETRQSITGISKSAIDALRESLQDQLNVKYANASSVLPIEVSLGVQKQIAVDTVPYLFGTLKSANISSLARFAEVPSQLRHAVVLTAYASKLDEATDSPSFSTTISLPKSAGKRLSISYTGASTADRDFLATVASSAAYSAIPVYAVNVVPEVRLEGNLLATGVAARMGADQYWNVRLTAPTNTDNGHTYEATAGDAVVVGVGAVDGSIEAVKARLQRVPSDTALENLHTISQAFWSQSDLLGNTLAAASGAWRYRLPSAGLFTAPLVVQYLFGVPRNGYFGSRGMDIARSIVAVEASDQNAKIRLMSQIGTITSYLEGATFDSLLKREKGAGVSSIQLLADANAQNIPIFRIDATNAATVIPTLRLDSEVIADIQNAVSTGLVAYAPESPPVRGTWRGEGYILQNEVDGTGAYLIKGGRNGGGDDPCDQEKQKEPVKVPILEILFALLALLALIALIMLAPELGPVVIAVMQRVATGLLIMLGLAAGNAVAQNGPPLGGPGNGLLPPGDCTVAQRLALQAAVDTYCHGAPSCKPFPVRGADCVALSNLTDRWNNCAIARTTINTTCFRGGNDNHRIAEWEAYQALYTCQCRKGSNGCP